MPGQTAKRDPAADARVSLVMDRPAFNQLSQKARLDDWVTAYEKGVLRATGDPNVLKLIGRVVELRRAKRR